MKKQEQNFYELFRPLKLYLGDVEQIVDTLSVDGIIVKVSDSEVVFDHVKEIGETRHDRFTGLEITAVNQPGKAYLSIAVSLEAHRACVRSFSPSNEVVGLCSKVAAILRARERSGLEMLYSHSRTAFLMLISLSAIVPIMGLWLGIGVVFWMLVGLYVLTAVLTFVGMHNQFNWHSVIIPRQPHQHSTYWKRNRDSIATTVLTGAMMGIGGFFLGKLVEKSPDPKATTSQPSAISATQPSSKPTTQP